MIEQISTARNLGDLATQMPSSQCGRPAALCAHAYHGGPASSADSMTGLTPTSKADCERGMYKSPLIYSVLRKLSTNITSKQAVTGFDLLGTRPQ